MKKTNNLNITNIQPLISPSELKKKFPMSESSNKTVVHSRESIINILKKKDKRLMAINAMESAKHAHSFIGIDQYGKTSIFKTRGNSASHIILRGGRSGPNYYEENVEQAEDIISKLEISPSIIVDCSHANSAKQYKRQQRVLRSILDQRNRGRTSIVGFMIESNLNPGAQDIPQNLNDLKYGVSITDACVGWEETEEMLLYAYKIMDQKPS